MFTLQDIQNLVLMAIEQNGHWWARFELSDDDHAFISCSIDGGKVNYFLMTTIKGQRETYFDCSLEFILNFDYSLEPTYSDIDLLDLYANHYSLNKTQLADNLGISRPTLNKYLSGSVPLPLIYKKFIALDLSIQCELCE